MIFHISLLSLGSILLSPTAPVTRHLARAGMDFIVDVFRLMHNRPKVPKLLQLNGWFRPSEIFTNVLGYRHTSSATKADLRCYYIEQERSNS